MKILCAKQSDLACKFSTTLIRILGSLTGLGWSLLAWHSHADGSQLSWMLAIMVVAWVALVGALPFVQRRHSAEILMFGLCFRVIAFFAVPVMEDDYYRFLWDGYRFAATGDPYAEAPLAHFGDERVPPAFRRVLDHINHPDVPSIYGPVSQWAFRLSFALAPASLWPWKLILFGAESIVFALLWGSLGIRGRLVLAWCPLAIFETDFNAHPDILPIALVIGSWWFARRSWGLLSGAALGFAIAAKFFALLLLPFLLIPQRWWAWLTASLALVFAYGPFWLHGNGADLTGLRTMAGQWEFNSSVFACLDFFVSRQAAQVICTVVFGFVWIGLLAHWLNAHPDKRTLPPGEWIYGAFLLFSAVANPWYCLWLWPFVAMRHSAAGLCALGAVSLSYLTGLNLGDTTLGNFQHPIWLRPLEFGLIAIVGSIEFSRFWKRKSACIP